jgi:hypothetical protein
MRRRVRTIVRRQGERHTPPVQSIRRGAIIGKYAIMSLLPRNVRNASITSRTRPPA